MYTGMVLLLGDIGGQIKKVRFRGFTKRARTVDAYQSGNLHISDLVSNAFCRAYPRVQVSTEDCGAFAFCQAAFKNGVLTVDV